MSWERFNAFSYPKNYNKKVIVMTLVDPKNKPALTSHIRTVSSKEPLATRFPCGLKETQKT